MEKKQRQNCCKLKIYPNLLKSSKKTGLVPFYLKLTYLKKKEFRLHETFDVTKEELKHWNKLKECIDSNDSKYEDLNIKLDEIKLNFKKYIREHNGSPVSSVDDIMLQIMGLKKNDSNQSILGFIDNYYKQTIDNSNELSSGTKINYKKAIGHFRNFCTIQGHKNMLLTEFKYADARKFQTWMGSKDGPNNLPSSASGIIKNLKHIIGEAVRCDLITKNPFTELKLNHKSCSHTSYLTIDQVKKIKDFEPPIKSSDLVFYKDLFLFSCFTGLSVCDVQKLSKEVILPVLNGRNKIDTSRQKTDKTIIQILPIKAQEIIKKYQGMNRSNVFPKFCPYTYNKKIKLIGAFSGLNINLTTKIARTTCHQMLINVRYIDDMYKRKYMGWSNDSDIRAFYTTIEDKVLMENTNLIDQYINDNLYKN